MKRWKSILTCFALICVLGIFFGIPARASEKNTTVPQVEFKTIPESITLQNGIIVNDISYTKKEITAADFEGKALTDIEVKWLNDSVENAEAIDAYRARFKTSSGDSGYITAGNLICTVPEGQNSSLLNDFSYFDMKDNAFELKDSEGIEWEPTKPMVCITDPQQLHNIDPGLWFIMTCQEKKYLLHIPVEVQCSDFLKPDRSGNMLTFGTITTRKEKNTFKKVSNDPTIKWEGDTGIIQIEQFDKTWGNTTGINGFIANYGYGARGSENVEEASYNASLIKAYKSEKPFSRLLEPYSFTVTNAKGEEKTYKLVVDMPWQVKNFITDREKRCAITVEAEEDTLNLAYGKQGGNIAEGTKVTLSGFLIPEGQKLESVILKEDNKNGKEILCEVKNNIASFNMPKAVATVIDFSTQPLDTTEHSINVSCGMTDSDEQTSGLVTITNTDGQPLSVASEGKEIHLKAGNLTNFESKYDYQFDHWEEESGLIPEGDKKNPEISFLMPAADVAIKAVYVHKGVSVTIGTNMPSAGHAWIMFQNNQLGSVITDNEHTRITDIYKAGMECSLLLSNPNLEGYRFRGWFDEQGREITGENIPNWKEDGAYRIVFNLPDSGSLTFIANFEAKVACMFSFESSNESMGTMSAFLDEKLLESNTVLYEEDSISLKAEPKTGYLFDHWEAVDLASGVEVKFADANAAETTLVIPAQTKLTVRAVFKVDPSFLSSACDMTKVELLDAEGKVVKLANKSGTTFTIKLSAEDMSMEEAGKLTSGSYKLRTTTSPKSVVELEGGFKDDATATWGAGVTCPISKNGEGTFIVHAENGTDEQRYTVKITYDDRPILTAGKVKRISDKDAEVTFTSSSKGMYYFEVVDSGAAKPDISTAGVGTPIKAADRENKITLNTLTAGAKDIYIVVKNDDDATDVKISDTLKMSIPAYDAEEVTYQVSLYKTEGGTIALTASKGTISTADAASGKPAVIDVKAGDTVKLTVTPNSGKRMVSGSLKRSQGGAPYEVKDIDEKTMQFVMPAYDLSVSCRFEDASAEEPNTSKKLNGFMVNGINGVINDASGTVMITLPNGTDLTKLSPTVVANGAKSIVPSSGAVVDLSKPVTYTLTFEDGTTKKYTVTAYTEAPSVSDRLWENMLDNAGGNTDHTGSRTWWEKAKKYKKNNDYPQYWAPLD